MCNVAFVQMATAVMGTIGQRQQRKATEQSANAARDDAFAGLNAQQLQINAQASDQATDRSRQAAMQAGTLTAIFADSGLSGASQDRIAAVAAGSASRDIDTIERNRQNKITQTNTEGNAIAARAASTINAVKRPSYLGAGLQIAALEAERRSKEK